MYKHTFHVLLLRHLQKRVEMILMRVHATVGKKSVNVQLVSAGLSVGHGFGEHGVFEKLTVLDHHVDLGDIHVHTTASADIQMPDLAVAHLTGWQANISTARVDKCVWKFRQQLVVLRLARKRNSIGFRCRRTARAVKDDKDKWF